MRIVQTRRGHRGGRWVILRPFKGTGWMGPYRTKAEAVEDARGLIRTFKRQFGIKLEVE